MQITPLVTGDNLKDYFLSHVKASKISNGKCDNFYEVIKPLHVFKKGGSRPFDTCGVPGLRVHANRIINLIIPVGATIFASDDVFGRFSDLSGRKMRASEAIVHSIVRFVVQDSDMTYYNWGGTDDYWTETLSEKNFVAAAEARSCHNPKFKYIPGKVVKPDTFSNEYDQCEGGIHFFLNVRDALRYL